MARRSRARKPEPRKLEHAAFLLPAFGALFLLPPLLTVFSIPYRLFGIPLAIVYLFTLWGLLITGAVLMSRHMPRPERRRPDSSGENGGEDDR